MTAQPTQRSQSDRWLSLGEASAVLGVHRSTLRRWADEGRIACQRTVGGHRRFDRALLLRSVAEQGETGAGSTHHPDPTQPSRTEAEWHGRLQDAGQVEQLRAMGQRLSGIVVQYLGRDDADLRLLAEARALGRDYAVRSRSAGMSVAQAVEAFLFYRANLVRLLSHDPAPAADGLARYERFDSVVSAVLVGLVRGYADAA